jgi:large subunit ribosomal protein L29
MSKTTSRTKELRSLSDAEIRERLQELRDELFKVRFRSPVDPDVNPSRLRTIRRDIARLRTIQRERELAQARGEQERKRA